MIRRLHGALQPVKGPIQVCSKIQSCLGFENMAEPLLACCVASCCPACYVLADPTQSCWNLLYVRRVSCSDSMREFLKAAPQHPE